MASDIWSLGATMYELLTGMPPYGEHGGLLQKNGADIPLINEEISQELKDIIYKCLTLNTWDRPTARQIADYALQHINGSSAPFSIQNSQYNTSDIPPENETNNNNLSEEQDKAELSADSDKDTSVTESSDIKKETFGSIQKGTSQTYNYNGFNSCVYNHIGDHFIDR